MVDICLYFNVHIPLKLKKYRIYDIGKNQDYFDKKFIEDIANKNGFESFFEMNKLLLSLINKYENKIKFSFSISGLAIEAMEKYIPTILSSFKELSKYDNVEFILEPYYNSISSLYSQDEFIFQVEKQKDILKKYFNKESVIFRNPEYIHSNELCNLFSKLNIKGVLVNGSNKLLKHKSANYLYQSTNHDLVLFPRNYSLSKELTKINDILKVNSIIDEIESIEDDIINLFVNYNDFNKSSIEYFNDIVDRLIDKNNFVLPSQIINKKKSIDILDAPEISSGYKSSTINNLTGNRLQQSAQEELYAIEKTLKEFNDETLLENWRKLTAVGHFFFMNVDGHFNKEFDNLFESPYDAYIYFMNALNDIILRLKLKEEKIKLEEELRQGKDLKVDTESLKNIVLE